MFGSIEAGREATLQFWQDHVNEVSQFLLNMSENFELTLFTLSDPIWVSDLGTEAKNQFFISVHP
jgi:hypothetical protein